MEIKTPIKFETFNDGFVDVYETDFNDKIIRNTRKRYFFGNETVGIKRYYAARQNDIDIKLVIHIQKNLNITTENAAVIQSTRYKIVQVQHFDNKNPAITVLSLEQRGLFKGADDEVS